jgi:hypothetical protein
MKELIEQVEKYLLKQENTIAKAVLRYFKTEGKDEELLDEYYDSFEKVLAMCIKYITTEYEIEVPGDIAVFSVTYDDMETFESRVREWLNCGDRNLALYHCLLILDNECYTIVNRIAYNLFKDIPDMYGEILHAEDCCGYCADTFDGPPVPVSEIKEIPPYHPSCRCVYTYFRKEIT